jgi:hypothetical protein
VNDKKVRKKVGTNKKTRACYIFGKVLLRWSTGDDANE